MFPKRFLSIIVLVSLNMSAVLQFSDQQRANLITKFAPEVRFHNEEKYFPMDVNAFLPFVDLRDGNKNVIIPKGQVNGQKLASYSAPANADYYLGFADKSMKGGSKPDQNKLVHAPVYANFIPLADGALIQYTFFYPFNGAFQIGELPAGADKIVNLFTKSTDIGDHEADWEHVNVILKGSSPDNVALQDVYFARHRPSQDGSYNKPELAEGTHPVVYASKWGHAAHHNHKDRHDDQDATSPNGPRWRTWEKAEYLGTKENPTAGHEWLKFTGHFGGTEGGKSSPRSPASQGWWRTSADQLRSEIAARVTVTKDESKKKESPEFEVKDLPTYIRHLNWNISKINTPGIQAHEIKYSVYNTKGELLFADLSGPRATTPLKDKKMYIGSVRVPGKSNVSFELEVRGQFDR